METQQQATRELPDDTLFEMASSCTLMETLASLRATAKSLNLATYEPTFTPKHLTSGFLIQSLIRNDYVIKHVTAPDDRVFGHDRVSLDFSPLKVKVNASSDALGLSYCQSQQRQSWLNGPNVKNHYVCKGVTREWLQIPNPKTNGDLRSASGIVVMNANPIRFKIVRLSNAKLNRQTKFDFNRYTCQVFDSEKPGKWRKLDKEIRLGNDGEWIKPDSQMVTVNMNLHLLVGPNRILVFDSLTEEWNFFSTPEPSKGGTLHRKLSKYQGKLSLIVENKPEETMTLYVMTNYKKKIWTKISHLCIQPVHQIDHLVSPDGFCNSETGLFIGYDAFIFYNFRNHSYKKLALDKLTITILGFQSDFRKMGWKTADDAKGYLERQDAKLRARLDPNLKYQKLIVISVCCLYIIFWLCGFFFLQDRACISVVRYIL